MYISDSFMCRLMCERCNYHTRSALVNCLLLSTTSHMIWWRKLCGIGLSITSAFTARTVCKVPWLMCRLMCERCNYHTRSALVNCLLLSTTSHMIWWRKLCGIGLSITSAFTARTVCKVPWPSVLFLFLPVIYYSNWKFWNMKRAIQILSTMVQQRIHK